MKTLPQKAQYYLYFVYCLGAAAAAAVALDIRVIGTSKNLWEVFLFVVMGLIAAGKQIPMMPFRNEKSDSTMSTVYLVTFITLLRLGPAAALLVGSLSTLYSCVFPLRQEWFRTFFNLSINLVQTLATSLVLLALNHGTVEITLPDSIPALVASSLTYFIINTGMVAIVIALCSDQKAILFWRDTFLWGAPSYFVGAIYSTVAVVFLKQYLLIIMLCGTPIAFLTLYSYKRYTSHAEALLQKSDALLKSEAQLKQLYLATIRSLATAIDAKDQFMHQHILRVQLSAVAIAKEMGLKDTDLTAIETSALLHDIGKMGVPDYVLHKPGRLTNEEFEMIKAHPRIGADILDPVEFPWPVVPGVKFHHEHWDGSGYPEGRVGEDIPLQGRILAVADVYDALTSPRSYRNAWSHDKAIAQIQADAGTHFDPAVVDAFVRVADEVYRELDQSGLSDFGDSSATKEDSMQRVTTPRATDAANQIRRASSELWTLYDVAQTLSTSLGVQDTLEILARKLETILPGTICLFLLPRAEAQGNLVVQVAVGRNRDFLEGSVTSDNSISQRVAQSRETYNGVYDPEDLLTRSSQTSAWVELKSALIVPLVYEGELLGTFNIYREEENAFSIHEQNLLERIGERTAMALSNGLLYDRTRSRAVSDPLTGLANIRYMADFVEERCQRSDTEVDRFSLLCIDLDSFKPINDNFGHQKGDQVLKDLAALFQSIAGRQNTVARYGGDEFLILLEGMDTEEAQRIARLIQDGVQGYDPGLVHSRVGALKLSASIGVATYPRDGQDWSALLAIADATMYIEKNEHKLRRLASHTAPSTNQVYERAMPAAEPFNTVSEFAVERELPLPWESGRSVVPKAPLPSFPCV